MKYKITNIVGTLFYISVNKFYCVFILFVFIY